jgi:glutamate racemase
MRPDDPQAPAVPGADPSLPIGVFDSGVGGLTVLRALRSALPGEALLYLGDTARVPYGTKSADSVVRYASQAAELLVARGIKLLVVACNTAASVALGALERRLAPLPVVGVVEPGASAAVAASRSQRHLVLATESTVRQGAYTRAIRALAPSARVEERACSLFVALAEEGWTRGAVPDAVAAAYLAPALDGPGAPDCVTLGCTHFPLLLEPIRRAVGPARAIVDSATPTAQAVRARLDALGLRASAADAARPGAFRLLATDGRARFARLGAAFLGEPVRDEDVELVDL